MRDSSPDRRRQRFGDMDYDWEHRVNTTSGTVQWRERLLGVFLSPYQPTNPAEFQEMMAALPIDLSEFTFIDLGSGKGRTLLMASEYSFRSVLGLEIVPELHRAAELNIREYRSGTQLCSNMESICADATNFTFPSGPLVLYLFNPFPENGLRQTLSNLGQRQESTEAAPLWVIYHNPILRHVFADSRFLVEERGAERYVLYRAV